MVKRALATFISLVFLSSSAYSEVYQINIVKERKSSEKPSRFIIYRVKFGDTLIKIMNMFKIPKHFLYEIVRINKIKNPNLIYTGQKIKLPSFSEPAVRKEPGRKFFEEIDLLKRLGGRIRTRGAIFVGDKEISFKKNPLVSLNGKDYLIDFGDLSQSLKRKIEELGINVLSPKKIGNLIDEYVESNFSEVSKNGKFILGSRDVLTYNYDYLVYDTVSGRRIVINRTPETPPPLKRLLSAYGITVVEPKFINPSPGEGWGKLKILKGEGIEKIANLISLLTGEKPKEIESGVLFQKKGIAVVYDSITPEERVRLEVNGNRVFVLTGNFLYDVENILSLVPIANKEVRLILNEPPGTKGKRSTFKIVGLLINAPKESWFLIDSVEKPEEIDYLRFRGVNLIFY